MRPTLRKRLIVLVIQTALASTAVPVLAEAPAGTKAELGKIAVTAGEYRYTGGDH